MTQHIYEGTSRELARYLAQHPDRKFRLIELIEESTEAVQPAPALDDKAKAAIALLNGWIAEGEAADEEARRQADQEVEEFKRGMNANRAATGERIVYP